MNIYTRGVFAQVQVEYHTVFVFWLLSFAGSKEQNAAVEEAMNAAEVPRRMTNVLREVTAEKVGAQSDPRHVLL